MNYAQWGHCKKLLVLLNIIYTDNYKIKMAWFKNNTSELE